MSDLVPQNARSFYALSEQASLTELKALEEEFREKGGDDIAYERALCRLMLQKSAALGDTGAMSNLLALSTSLAKECRVGSIARSEYLHRGVVKEYVQQALEIA